MPLDRPALKHTWNENGHAMGKSDPDDTLVLPKMELTPEKATEVMAKLLKDPNRLVRERGRFELLKGALDLVMELWPKPGYATVTLETHQWVRLRRILLSVPELVADDE